VRTILIAVTTFLLMTACVTAPLPDPMPQQLTTQPPAGSPPVVPDIAQRVTQLPRTMIDYDRQLLDANETAVVEKLIEASRYMDQIFWLQVSERNYEWYLALLAAAPHSDQHAEALHYFLMMKGPWDRLAGEEPFVLNAGPKPPGSAFYPADATREELEAAMAASPGQREAIQNLFTVVRRHEGRLVTYPYSVYYRSFLEPAAAALREAAALTTNASLRNYLEKRATAFLTDDYFESDLAWMDLDSNIEVVIGPYEVYEDRLMNLKAAFESFVTVVDQYESRQLEVYGAHLMAMERNLPIPDEHKNVDRGTESPIKVVQEIYTAGDARRGVQTAAFNLPNDERVREVKGSKKVLLKNVMEAKYAKAGEPIALRVIDPAQAQYLTFDAFFNQVLFHELSHGLGPGVITTPEGERVEVRLQLRELYSAIEEAKADVVGIWSLLYAIDQGLLTGLNREQLFTTDAAVMFRSMRFGIDGAHGRGNAVQWNWHREREAIVPAGQGRFRVDFARFEESIRALSEELLMIQATGDYERASRLLEQYGRSTPEIEATIASLADIPVDITPFFVAAGER
jgi:hypothetical protein